MWASCVWVENLLLLSLTVLDPKVHFWNKMHKENMSRCHQIWNRRSMKHFWNLTPVHKNFICKKNWDFQIKFSILMYQCSELLIKINLAWSKSAEEIPQVDSHHLPIGIFFSKNCSKKKKYVFLISIWFFHLPKRCVKVWRSSTFFTIWMYSFFTNSYYRQSSAYTVL